MGNKLKTFLLLLGDIAALYLALLAALWLRYGTGFYAEFVLHHAEPFTIIFVVWLIVFFIAGLYDLRRLRNDLEFLKTLGLSLIVNAVLAILLFYLVPAFGIAPKTNLLIFLGVFAVIEILWRRGWNQSAGATEAPNRVLFVGDGALADEIEKAIRANPQLGYAIDLNISADSAEREPAALERLAADSGVNLVVVPRHLKRNGELARVLYRLFGQGLAVIDLASFYELVLRKIPLADLEETWFLENVESAARFYDPLKRALEFLFAFVVGLVLLPLELLIALLVKLTSRGPVFIRQKRVGRFGKEFALFKFRSMVALAPDGQAETKGAEWSPGKADARVTPFGRFLRASHLDELPQLWNVVHSDISFVGPRPERPEFVAKLKEQVPYYEMRLLVKPGVSGWAQLNYRADRDIEDVKQKLQYDIYYLKNRSAVLDLAIIVKTIKSLFVNPE
jgi:exopolysaccharide biosynthesis polyprenyl glycosylphosphotransferase